MNNRLLGGTVVALVAFNIARALRLFGDFADAVEFVLAFVLLAAAIRSGLTLERLGLARKDVRRGLLYGAGAFALVLAVVSAAALIPATSDFLNDSRVDVGFARMLFEVFVAILFGTVIPEELIFRGVLLGSAMERWGGLRGALVSSALFGLWHISPTLNDLGGNAGLAEADSSLLGKTAAVAGAVLATFCAGVIFSWLRERSRSLVAPVMAHLSTNGVAFLVAWFVAR